ncbi:MAG: glutamine amidotransferase, partial [Pirellulales bacterium]
LGLSGSYALVSGVCFVMLIAWMAAVFFSDATPRRRVVLGVLRLLVIVLLVLAMLRPTQVFTEMKPQVASLIVLFDQSRSMTVADGFGGMTRWEALTQTVVEAEPTLRELADKLELRPYGFDAEARLLSSEDGVIQLPAAPQGEQSAYGAALAEVLRQEDGKRLAGVILLGDGAEQTFGTSRQLPQSAARQLAQLGVPLYTAAFGQRVGGQQARDVALESMTDNPTVFVNNELAITGSIRVNGYVGQDIPVQLRYEVEPGRMEVVDTQVIRASGDNEQVEFSLKHIPTAAGEFKVEVVATPQDGEVTTTNNQLPTYVTVLPGGLRVLYVEGELRREQKFLRRALDSSPDMEVDFEWINRKTQSQWPITLQNDPFGSGKYNVIILGDVDSKALSPEDWEALAQAVRRGAGLIMLGGYQTFRPGGYQFTPLAGVLPVEMDPQIDRLVRQSIGGAISPDLHLEGPLPMQPTPLGLRHYIMNLNPGEPTAEAWAELPPLSGANRFRGVKPGAAILAETPQGAPLLVAGDVGGRTLAFAGDSTWRWVMQGDEKAHQRFWRQVVLWLARKEEIAKGNVWVRLESRRFAPGASIHFTAGAQNDQREPILDGEFRAEVVHNDTRQRVRLARQGDVMRGTFFAGLEA